MKYALTHAYRFGITTLLILLIAGASSATGVMIPASAVKATVGYNVGNGLYGEFYKPHLRVNHIDTAERVVATMKPDSTFYATSIDYPNGFQDVMLSNRRLSKYLGRDSDSLKGDGRVDLSNSGLRFYGHIKITKEMDGNPASRTIDVRVAVGSDDGCRVRIGGQIVTEWLHQRPFGFVSGVARFLVEGLYKIEILCFEHTGHTGIEIYTNIRGGSDHGAPEHYAGILPTHILSSKKYGIGGKISGLDATNQQCWNLTTDQVVQAVETSASSRLRIGVTPMILSSKMRLPLQCQPQN